MVILSVNAACFIILVLLLLLHLSPRYQCLPCLWCNFVSLKNSHWFLWILLNGCWAWNGWLNIILFSLSYVDALNLAEGLFWGFLWAWFIRLIGDEVEVSIASVYDFSSVELTACLDLFPGWRSTETTWRVRTLKVCKTERTLMN